MNRDLLKSMQEGLLAGEALLADGEKGPFRLWWSKNGVDREWAQERFATEAEAHAWAKANKKDKYETGIVDLAAERRKVKRIKAEDFPPTVREKVSTAPIVPEHYGVMAGEHAGGHGAYFWGIQLPKGYDSSLVNTLVKTFGLPTNETAGRWEWRSNTASGMHLETAAKIVRWWMLVHGQPLPPEDKNLEAMRTEAMEFEKEMRSLGVSAGLAFNTWLDTFISEKGIDLEETFEVEGPSGMNFIPYGVIIEHMKIAPPQEQAAIKDTMVKLDFKNADIRGFLRHLGKAIAASRLTAEYETGMGYTRYKGFNPKKPVSPSNYGGEGYDSRMALLTEEERKILKELEEKEGRGVQGGKEGWVIQSEKGSFLSFNFNASTNEMEPQWVQSRDRAYTWPSQAEAEDVFYRVQSTGAFDKIGEAETRWPSVIKASKGIVAAAEGMLSVGDTVLWRGSYGRGMEEPAKIESITLADQPGGSDGVEVQRVNWSLVPEWVTVGLADNKGWAYGYQLKPMPADYKVEAARKPSRAKLEQAAREVLTPEEQALYRQLTVVDALHQFGKDATPEMIARMKQEGLIRVEVYQGIPLDPYLTPAGQAVMDQMYQKVLNTLQVAAGMAKPGKGFKEGLRRGISQQKDPGAWPDRLFDMPGIYKKDLGTIQDQPPQSGVSTVS